MGISGWTAGAVVAKGEIYIWEILWKCVTDSVSSWEWTLAGRLNPKKNYTYSEKRPQSLCSVILNYNEYLKILDTYKAQVPP